MGLGASPPERRADAPAANFWMWGRPTAPRGGTAAPPGADPLALEERTHRRLFEQGSLAGTEAAGDWCVNDARLHPCAALRERFDHYLLGLGEVSAAALRALVRRDAARAQGEAMAAQIMDLWDRYGAVREQAPRVPFDARDRSSWSALLAEQRGVRRRLLGDDWARAFYGDEENDFDALRVRLDAGAASPVDPGAPVEASPAARLERFGVPATARLAAVDEAWADWEQRLALARDEWSRLRAAPELSESARQASIRTYLEAHFRDDERVRVRALLRL